MTTEACDAIRETADDMGRCGGLLAMHRRRRHMTPDTQAEALGLDLDGLARLSLMPAPARGINGEWPRDVGRIGRESGAAIIELACHLAHTEIEAKAEALVERIRDRDGDPNDLLDEAKDMVIRLAASYRTSHETFIRNVARHY